MYADNVWKAAEFGSSDQLRDDGDPLGRGGLLEMVFGLFLPLGLIWFPEEVGNLTGYYKTGYVNVQTPGGIISFTGWFILVGCRILYTLTR